MRQLVAPASLLALSLTLPLGSSSFADGECRSLDALRIDFATQVLDLQDVCHVDTLAIFADDPQLTEVMLPNLQTANSISVESYDLQALSLPSLVSAGQIYLQ